MNKNKRISSQSQQNRWFRFWMLVLVLLGVGVLGFSIYIALNSFSTPQFFLTK
jgi:hypothetical protein